jgi:hypothetical protein
MTVITNVSLSDGFGSQYQHIISCILICIHKKYTFIYTPIQKMEHNYNNDPHFIENIEEFMNLRKFFTTIEESSEEEKKNMRVFGMDAKYEIDRHVDTYANENALSIIRYMFWENKNKNAIFNNDNDNDTHNLYSIGSKSSRIAYMSFRKNRCTSAPIFRIDNKYTNVVIHIRRPNIHDNRTSGTDVSIHTYMNVIHKIREENPDKKLLFHIHSQGEEHEFEMFRQNNETGEAHDIILYLNCDLRESFLQMCAADILVISASSFSYIAAFICEGTVYYIPFWHKPRNTWIPYTNQVVKL